MKKWYHNFTRQIVPLTFLWIIVLVIVPVIANSQILAVKGVVATSTRNVQYASVMFIDIGDTTKKFSILTDTSGSFSIDLPTVVKPNPNQPADFELEQNYPNPFSYSTAISYSLNTHSNVKVTLYDILGKEIKSFAAGSQEAGLHGVLWDGRNEFGSMVANGVYFYRLEVGEKSLVKKMVFVSGDKNVVVLQPGKFSSAASRMEKGMSVFLQTGKFALRVENTDSTFPAIIPQQFDNVVLQNDTMMNITVNANGTFPDPNAAMVYFDSPQQVIRGFGGANILQWRPDMTAAQVQTAFGNGPGQIGFTILRLRVPYDLSEANCNMQVATAKLAQSLGAIVFASPWTPPAWMKTNNNLVGGSLNDTSYASFASHLKSFTDYMSAHSAPLYAISLQNEPDASVTYESCSWNGTQFLNFMKNNAASIGTRIMMPESQNFVHALSDPTLNDSIAAANVSIIAGHLYGGGLTSYPLAASRGKEIWMTEYLDTDTSWSAVLRTGKQMSDCMKLGWNAYVWWYTVRFYGPVDENGNVSKRGYVMSQYARFVRPGFRMVSATDNSIRTLVDVTAYKNGFKRVIVAVNRRTTARIQTFTMWNGTVGTFSPYVTSSNKNCEQQSDFSFKNGSFTYILEPLSVTTFVSN